MNLQNYILSHTNRCAWLPPQQELRVKDQQQAAHPAPLHQHTPPCVGVGGGWHSLYKVAIYTDSTSLPPTSQPPTLCFSCHLKKKLRQEK